MINSRHACLELSLELNLELMEPNQALHKQSPLVSGSYRSVARASAGFESAALQAGTERNATLSDTPWSVRNLSFVIRHLRFVAGAPCKPTPAYPSLFAAQPILTVTMQLEELVCQVPSLLDFAHPECLKALSSSSTTLRRLVHSHVTELTVLDLSEPSEAKLLETARLLVQGNWSHLRSLKLCFRRGHMSCQSKGILPLEWWQPQMAVQVRHPYTASLSVDFVSQLRQASWPFLEKLDLSSNLLGKHAIAELVRANWSKLSSVDLSDTGLYTASMAKLVTAPWPLLHTLHLSRNNFTAAALKCLQHSNWPQLSCISLASNTLVHSAQGIAHLCNAGFTHLQVLNLSGTQIEPALWFSLSSGEWPCLHHLDLSNTSLNSAGVSHLAKGNWPQLKCLRLRSSFICPDGIRSLASANWPLVESLDLSFTWGVLADCYEFARLGAGWSHLNTLHLNGCGTMRAFSEPFHTEWTSLQYLSLAHSRFDLSDIKILTLAELPVLQHLCLLNNHFGTDAVVQLKEGCWPLLKVLDLSLNVVSKDGAEALIMGKWPVLEHLSITMSCLNVETLQVILKNCMPLLSVLHITGCPSEGWEGFENSRRALNVRQVTENPCTYILDTPAGVSAWSWPCMKLFDFNCRHAQGHSVVTIQFPGCTANAETTEVRW